MDEGLLTGFASVEDKHWWFVVRRRVVMAELARRSPGPVDRVLEVGCGTGGTFAALSSAFASAHVSGVEPSPSAADLAKQRGCEVTVGTFEQLEAADGTVDVLVALDVIEHCEDDAAALAEAWRVLRPGGLLLLTVPALPSMWSGHDELNGHYRRYGAAQLRQVVEGARFVPERVTYFMSILLPLAWLVRRVSRVLRTSASAGVGMPPASVNTALRALFGAEERWLRSHDLPVGLSLLVSARKP